MLQPGEREQQSEEAGHETDRKRQGIQGTVEQHANLSDAPAVPRQIIGMRSIDAEVWSSAAPPAPRMRGVAQGYGDRHSRRRT